MNDLKPVVTVLHPDRDGKRVSLIDLNKFHALPVGAELYIIPDTHRVVSVELLHEIIVEMLDEGLAWTARNALQTIIDNKEPHNE